MAGPFIFFEINGSHRVTSVKLISILDQEGRALVSHFTSKGQSCMKLHLPQNPTKAASFVQSVSRCHGLCLSIRIKTKDARCSPGRELLYKNFIQYFGMRTLLRAFDLICATFCGALSWINWVESKGSPPTWACTAELGWCSQTLAIKTTKEVPGASVRVGEYIGSRLLAASILVNNGGHWLCYALCWYRHCKPRQER